MSSEHLLQAMRDDGYTVTKHIKEIPNLYAATTMEVRPTGMGERALFLDKIARFEGATDQEQRVNLEAAKVMVRKIKSWDAVNAKGDAVPLEVDAILDSARGLQPLLFVRIRSIVCYASDGGDAVPGKSGNREDDDSDAELLARLQKNSEMA